MHVHLIYRAEPECLQESLIWYERYMTAPANYQARQFDWDEFVCEWPKRQRKQQCVSMMQFTSVSLFVNRKESLCIYRPLTFQKVRLLNEHGLQDPFEFELLAKTHVRPGPRLRETKLQGEFQQLLRVYSHFVNVDSTSRPIAGSRSTDEVAYVWKSWHYYQDLCPVGTDGVEWYQCSCTEHRWSWFVWTWAFKWTKE